MADKHFWRIFGPPCLIQHGRHLPKGLLMLGGGGWLDLGVFSPALPRRKEVDYLSGSRTPLLRYGKSLGVGEIRN